MPAPFPIPAAPRRLARALQRLAAAPRVAAQRYGQVADHVVRRLLLLQFEQREAEGLDVVIVEGRTAAECCHRCCTTPRTALWVTGCLMCRQRASALIAPTAQTALVGI